ncbi:hypothetical protein [Nannocystis radixulma]|uniref:Uncharacterized protein n=1 Tax=Nannocystis radixulma TaxID=2995305 RepID=A0ABT5AYH4_9BACT|nr:hypothetical protein [Nannocystis radixulma]MDC0666902.1 hypothetical protein [Nannocystis radixulma]
MSPMFTKKVGDDVQLLAGTVAAVLAQRLPSWVDRELVSFIAIQQALWVHEGDLVVEGSFQPPHPAVLVTGDLVVDGSVFTGCPGGPPSTFLLVVGTVRCSSLLVEHEATTVIAGGLVAREAIIAHKVADTATYVGRRLEAACLMEGNGADVRVEDAAVSVGVRVRDGGTPIWRVFSHDLLDLEVTPEELLRREQSGEDVGDLADLELTAIKQRLLTKQPLGLLGVGVRQSDEQ